MSKIMGFLKSTRFWNVLAMLIATVAIVLLIFLDEENKIWALLGGIVLAGLALLIGSVSRGKGDKDSTVTKPAWTAQPSPGFPAQFPERIQEVRTEALIFCQERWVVARIDRAPDPEFPGHWKALLLLRKEVGLYNFREVEILDTHPQWPLFSSLEKSNRVDFQFREASLSSANPIGVSDYLRLLPPLA